MNKTGGLGLQRGSALSRFRDSLRPRIWRPCLRGFHSVLRQTPRYHPCKAQRPALRYLMWRERDPGLGRPNESKLSVLTTLTTMRS
jgi:hypothetical protein